LYMKEKSTIKPRWSLIYIVQSSESLTEVFCVCVKVTQKCERSTVWIFYTKYTKGCTFYTILCKLDTKVWAFLTRLCRFFTDAWRIYKGATAEVQVYYTAKGTASFQSLQDPENQKDEVAVISRLKQASIELSSMP
jgi:hypothetical protein